MSNDNPNPPPNPNPNPQDPSTPGSLRSKDNNNNSNNNKQADQNSSKTNQDPSLLNRIQTSATGLLRDAITNPNAHALGSDLGQLGGAANGKASSSRWTGSQNYDSISGASTTTTTTTTTSSSRNGAANAAEDSNVAPTESFRTTTQSNNLFDLEGFDQEHFQHDYGDEYQSIGKGKGKGKERISISSSEEYDAAWIHAVATAQHSNNHYDTHDTQNHTHHHQGQDDADGAAVVSLLSDPSFQPEFADDDDLYEDPDMAVPAPLTADEIRILDSFRRQQSSATTTPTHPKTSAITPHSLIPDIDTFLADNDGISVGTSDAALRDAVLHNLPGAEDWVAVNDRYQDEVWGFLRPALEAASKEIEENDQKESDPAREGPAVLRLKMILRHMKL
ncbi:uncharacterized protein TRUGW13939_02270 [Talaromyces rugulosus]|uniref:Uncharacterized protein n=1 Tax=Talaromyces rugulosus TaxID=121627 RepID=A0A7H8QMT7_TALRU|nr:uncharacterized protein TRUGW13939_02270 [Talaromyces rugulosus]QKX55178.1 hypothetical protein TRUGW13939_02270 [Talaromyces rugulosus]